MEIDEIQVLVCEARNINSKKDGLSVIFGIGNEKYKTTIQSESLAGITIWNEEQSIPVKVQNSKSSKYYKPLLFNIMDKNVTVGKITIPLTKLSTSRKRFTSQIIQDSTKEVTQISSDKEKTIPILIYEAWITKYHLVGAQGTDSPQLRNESVKKKESFANIKDGKLNKNMEDEVNDVSTQKNTQQTGNKKKSSGSLTKAISHLGGEIRSSLTPQNNTTKDTFSEISDFIKHHHHHKRNASGNNIPSFEGNESNKTRPADSISNDGSTTSSSHLGANQSTSSSGKLPSQFSQAVKAIFHKASFGTNANKNNENQFGDSSLDLDKENTQFGIRRASSRSYEFGNNSKLDAGNKSCTLPLNAALNSQTYNNTEKILMENDTRPIITGISPMEAPIDRETKIILRGQNLGLNAEDIISIHIAGIDCTRTLNYYNASKVSVLLWPTKNTVSANNSSFTQRNNNNILLVTKSGGVGRCLIDFTIKMDENTMNGTHYNSSLDPQKPQSYGGHFYNELIASDAGNKNTEAKLENFSSIALTNNPYGNSNSKEQSYISSVGEKDLNSQPNIAAAKQKNDNNIVKNISSTDKKSINLAKTLSERMATSTEQQSNTKSYEDTNFNKKINKFDAANVNNNTANNTNNNKIVMKRFNPKMALANITNGVKNDSHMNSYTKNNGADHKGLNALEQCSKDTLIAEIQSLRKHIEDLTTENQLMKHYVDSLVLRVMEVCPEHLENFQTYQFYHKSL